MTLYIGMDIDLQYALNYFTSEQKSPSIGRFSQYIRQQSSTTPNEFIQDLFLECIRWIRRQPAHTHLGWASHQIIIPRLNTPPPYDNGTAPRTRDIDSELQSRCSLKSSCVLSPTPLEELISAVDETDIDEVDGNDAAAANDDDDDDDDDDDRMASSHAQWSFYSQPAQELRKKRKALSSDPAKGFDSNSEPQDRRNNYKKQNKGRQALKNKIPPQDHHLSSNLKHPETTGTSYDFRLNANPPQGSDYNLLQHQDLTWQNQLLHLQQRLTSLESNLCSLQTHFPETSRYLILDALTTSTPLSFSGDAKADAELYLSKKRTDFRLFLHLYGLDPAFVKRLQNPLAIYVVNTYATNYALHGRLQPAFEEFLKRMGRCQFGGIGEPHMEYMDVESTLAARAFLDVVDDVLKQEVTAKNTSTSASGNAATVP